MWVSGAADVVLPRCYRLPAAKRFSVDGLLEGGSCARQLKVGKGPLQEVAKCSEGKEW